MFIFTSQSLHQRIISCPPRKTEYRAIILRTSTIFKIAHSKKTVRRGKTGCHPSESESRLSPWLHLTIDAQAPAEVRFDTTTEWVARCQLLSAINRIRSLFPLFAQPLSLSVRVLPTLLLLSLMFLSHIQDTSSLFSSLMLINIWLN